MTTQRQTILNLLKQLGSTGLNSYDADYIHHVKQCPTRIWELKKEGHTIITRTNPDKSVNWILVGSPRGSDVNPNAPEQKEDQYVWVGNTAIPRENLKPVQEGMFV